MFSSSLSRISFWSFVSNWISDICVAEDFALYSNSDDSRRVKRSKAFYFRRCEVKSRDAFNHAWFNKSFEHSLNFIIVDSCIHNKVSRMIENRIIDDDDVLDISTFIAFETFSCVDDNVSPPSAIFSFSSCFDVSIFCSLKYRQWKCTSLSFRIFPSVWSYHRSYILWAQESFIIIVKRSIQTDMIVNSRRNRRNCWLIAFNAKKW